MHPVDYQPPNWDENSEFHLNRESSLLTLEIESSGLNDNKRLLNSMQKAANTCRGNYKNFIIDLSRVHQSVEAQTNPLDYFFERFFEVFKTFNPKLSKEEKFHSITFKGSTQKLFSLALDMKTFNEKNASFVQVVKKLNHCFENVMFEGFIRDYERNYCFSDEQQVSALFKISSYIASIDFAHFHRIDFAYGTDEIYSLVFNSALRSSRHINLFSYENRPIDRPSVLNTVVQRFLNDPLCSPPANLKIKWENLNLESVYNAPNLESITAVIA